MPDETETVPVPSWALEFILDRTWLLCDAGPSGEGWQSDRMTAAIKALEVAMYGQHSSPLPKGDRQ